MPLYPDLTGVACGEGEQEAADDLVGGASHVG